MFHGQGSHWEDTQQTHKAGGNFLDRGKLLSERSLRFCQTLKASAALTKKIFREVTKEECKLTTN
jgi:hypothetical protein